MRFIGNVETDGQVRVVASGALPNGKPVVVNSDGTASVVSIGSPSASTPETHSIDIDSDIRKYSVSYDTSVNKVVVVFQRQSDNYPCCVIGTVSGTSISFGTPVVIASRGTNHPRGAVNNNGTVMAAYMGGSSDLISGSVGTISGNSVTFGSQVQLDSTRNTYTDVCYDSGSDVFVVVWKDNADTGRGKIVACSYSGTSLTVGSVSNVETAQGDTFDVVYDPNADKTVVSYRDRSGGATDLYLRCKVVTVSGTSVSLGTAATILSANGSYIDAAYDSSSQKIVFAYQKATSGVDGAARVGTISGTSISFGTETVFASGPVYFLPIVYDSGANKVVVVYRDGNNSQFGTFKVGTVSGTDISFGSAVVFDGYTNTPMMAYDPDSSATIVLYVDVDNSSTDTYAFLYAAPSTLNADNYIGMSSGGVDSSGSSGRTGSETVFEAATSRYVYSAYDSNSDKVVIAYADNGNSQYGTAIVGTVSGTTISFGSPVVFESAEVQNVGVTFDSNSNKVVITYADEGNSSYPTAIVGTVSGTSISFGTPVVVDSANADSIVSTFDSTNNKVVVGFRNPLGNQYPMTIVGTVSGTSISFGTSATIESVVVGSNRLKLAYHSNSGKVVSVYTDSTSALGRCAIGTVSGTSISFGTPVTFVSNLASSLGVPVIDSDTNKVIITYKDNGNSNYGTAKVGTISGTSISFGSASVFNQGNSELYSGQAYNPTLQKVIVAFRDDGDSNIGKYVYGTVSGTDITFSTEVSFNSGRADNLTMVYDPVSTNMVLTFEDNANSSHGTSLVFSPDTLIVTRGEIADGGSAIIDTTGAISRNQINLTVGSKYYVQTDGTLSTTAGSPSVEAGIALSATELLVKG